jgi:predicted RNA-binding Zn-ribbon protein involved in translation (DUF1610 family)
MADRTQSPPAKARHKVGEVVVICPSCGNALSAAVKVSQVVCFTSYLNVHYEHSQVNHECPGGHA